MSTLEGFCSSARVSIAPQETSFDVVVVANFCCEVTVSQNFVNKIERGEGVVSDVAYSFPLDGLSAVCDFTATLSSGVTIQGVVKEKEEAKQTYDHAIERGEKAIIMIQDSSTMFRCVIGNLDFDEECFIVIKYVKELDFEGEKIKLTIPNIRTDKLTQTSICVEAEMNSSIKEVESTTHKDLFTTSVGGGEGEGHGGETDDSRITITMLDNWQSKFSNKDITFLFTIEDPHQIRSQLEVFQKTQSEALLLTFCNAPVTQTQSADLFCELIFLVDVSGSMSGQPISSVQKTLQLFLRSLPTKCIFNIVSFNSNFKKLFETRSTKYDQSSLTDATKFVDNLSASGGTNILKPLEHLMTLDPVEGYPRQIFLLTDGKVGNKSAVFKVATEKSSDCRVFTFGIGARVDNDLCEGIARAADGKCELILDNDQISEIVVRSLVRALQPPLCDVSVDWGKFCKEGNQVMQYPEKQAQMYPFNRYFMYGINPSAPQQGAQEGGGEEESKTDDEEYTVKITGKFTDQRETVFDVPVVPKNAKTGCLIHALAAKCRISELELLNESPANKQEIIDLSTRYNISSRHAHFVAIEDIEERGEEGRMHLVPSEGTKASDVQAGQFIDIDGKLCEVSSVKASKTGKHGVAKFYIQGTNPVTGKKVSTMSQGNDSFVSQTPQKSFWSSQPVQADPAQDKREKRRLLREARKKERQALRGKKMEQRSSEISMMECSLESMTSNMSMDDSFDGFTFMSSSASLGDPVPKSYSLAMPRASESQNQDDDMLAERLAALMDDTKPRPTRSYQSEKSASSYQTEKPKAQDEMKQEVTQGGLDFDTLVRQQQFDGSWLPFSLIQKQVDDLLAALKSHELLGKYSFDRTFCASVVCLHILQRDFSGRSSELVMIIVKANSFLESVATSINVDFAVVKKCLDTLPI